MRCGPFFELDERHAAGCVWLTLSGELDLGTAPRLGERLDQLREEKRPVVVDLSGLEFMDSSGVYVLSHPEG
jgi:anti-anti-sigma factor